MCVWHQLFFPLCIFNCRPSRCGRYGMQASPAKFSARAMKASLWLGAASLAFALFIRDCRKTHVNKVIPTMSAISFCAFWLSALVPLSAITLASQITSSTAEMNLPDMNLILQGIEDAQHQNPAHVAIASDAASSVTSPNRAMRFISCLFLDRGPHQNEMLIAIPGRPGYLRLNR